MTVYLESLDGNQSYRADLFSTRTNLENGKIYSIDELGFSDWLKISGQHKPPQKKLKAVFY